MLRTSAVLLCCAAVLLNPSLASAQIAAPEGFKVASTEELHAGVEYVKLSNPKVPLVAHVAHVAPGAAVDLRVVNANDQIPSNGSELENTSSMCARVHCVVGVNGDFHKNGVPAGGVVVDGRLLHTPDPDRPQLTVKKDGSLVAGPFQWSGILSSGGVQVPISRINDVPVPGDGLTLFTPEYGSNTTNNTARTELVVKTSRAAGTLNKIADLELVAVRTGGGSIPGGGAVLSAEGAIGQQLRDLWARRQGGTAVKLTLSSPVDARMSVGAEPVLLRDGKPALPWRDPNLVNYNQPHTLVGWNKQGDVYLVAIDGRQSASEGVTLAGAAAFLQGLGVTDAVNLDGGGGTTFVTDGKVRNRPSDDVAGHPNQFDERSGANAFVVIARPADGSVTPNGQPGDDDPADPADPGATADPVFRTPGVPPTGIDGQPLAPGEPGSSLQAAAGGTGQTLTMTSATGAPDPAGDQSANLASSTSTTSGTLPGEDELAGPPYPLSPKPWSPSSLGYAVRSARKAARSDPVVVLLSLAAAVGALPAVEAAQRRSRRRQESGGSGI